MRSETIPVPRSHIPHTDSELQLHENMADAEWRDICMYDRLVRGIYERYYKIATGTYEQSISVVAIKTMEQSLESIESTRRQSCASSLQIQAVTPSGSTESSLCSSLPEKDELNNDIPVQQLESEQEWSISGFENIDWERSADLKSSGSTINTSEMEHSDDDEDTDIFNLEL
eukprot:scaffold656680_cov51-Attheya_sp.AAC.1